MRQTRLKKPFSLFIIVGGARFETPVVNGILNHGPDPALLSLYSRVLPHLNGLFLDVGANIGQTLLAVRSISDRMPYVGFEPNPFCVTYLTMLIKRNRIRGVSIVPAAVMHESGILELEKYYDDEADPTASLIRDFRPEQTVIEKCYVPAFCWKEINPHFKSHSVGFVKIDVEGAEFEVICALREMLETNRPWLGIEILPAYREDYSDRFKRQCAIEDILRRMDYILLRIERDEDHSFSHLRVIRSIGVRKDVKGSDYVAVPAESAHLLNTLHLAPHEAI